MTRKRFMLLQKVNTCVYLTPDNMCNVIYFYSTHIVIDCQVSEWSNWSKCDVVCGIGTSTRTREILRPESNGGRQCPPLEESRSCRATKCSTRYLDKTSALKGIPKYGLHVNFESELIIASSYVLN